MAVASRVLISGSRFTAKLFLLPLTRILDISDADTLHDLDKYSIGSNGVCGGGISSTASSSSISMPKVPATSLAFQPFSMAILQGREAYTKHKERSVEPPCCGRQQKEQREQADRSLAFFSTPVSKFFHYLGLYATSIIYLRGCSPAICSRQLSYLRPWRAHDMALKKPGEWIGISMVVGGTGPSLKEATWQYL